MTIEGIVAAAVAVEVVVAIVLTVSNYREFRFLNRVKPAIERELPLFAALVSRAMQVSLIGLYLLAMTASTVLLGYNLAVNFLPLRAINGAAFLVLLAGPTVLGRAMRREVKER